MTKEIGLGIGYIIDIETGEIVGCSSSNFKKPVKEQYKEIILFLLEEFAKSNNTNLESIKFI